jgi:hypothetical protein
VFFAQCQALIGTKRASRGCDTFCGRFATPPETAFTLTGHKEKAMRSLVLTLVATAVFGLAPSTVRAGNPYRGYYQPNYSPNYGYQVNNYYPGGIAYPYHYGSDPHTEAVWRIRAAHSRYRYYTHPRALDNSPPTHADYFGWGY